MRGRCCYEQEHYAAETEKFLADAIICHTHLTASSLSGKPAIIVVYRLTWCAKLEANRKTKKSQVSRFSEELHLLI